MLVTDICLSVSCQEMFLQLISANRQNTLFNYAFHKSSLFSIFFYVFSKKLLTTSVFSCIVHYVVEMQQNFIIKVVQEWRNWQTRRLQVPVVAISCGFKSRFLHYFLCRSVLSCFYLSYPSLGPDNTTFHTISFPDSCPRIPNINCLFYQKSVDNFNNFMYSIFCR